MGIMLNRRDQIELFYNHVNKIERQSSRGGGFKLKKKATQASLFNDQACSGELIKVLRVLGYSGELTEPRVSRG